MTAAAWVIGVGLLLLFLGMLVGDYLKARGECAYCREAGVQHQEIPTRLDDWDHP